MRNSLEVLQGMIIGIGTDLCRVSRMERAASRDGFIDRFFSDEEARYAASKARPAEHLAASFAAREALGKALGDGLFKSGAIRASVRRTDDGPIFVIPPDLQKYFDERGVKRAWLSITHEGDLALAFAVLEG